MKKLAFTVVGLMVFIIPGDQSMAQGTPRSRCTARLRPQGIVAQYHGVGVIHADENGSWTCPIGGVCAGYLVTCADDQNIILANDVSTFLEGICDDHNPASANCAGRFTAYGEGCFTPRAASPVGDSTIIGEGRVCFDPDATPEEPAHCEGSVAELEAAGITVVGKVSYRQQVRHTESKPDQWTMEVSVRAGRPFTDAGCKKRLDTGKLLICEGTTQADRYNSMACFGLE